MGNDPPSRAVVETVADAEGVDPVDLEPPLYEVIDAEALDRLFRGGAGEVTFEYAGYEVTVDSEARVALAPPVRD
jgi:hypothetical protein